MKRFLLIYLICLSIFIIFISLAMLIIIPIFRNLYINTLSPLPSLFTFIENNKITSLDLWIPLVNQPDTDYYKLELNAKAALSYDLTTNKLLYEKNSHFRLPMASLTKIATAVIILENMQENQQLSVKKKDLVGENSMGLSSNEKISVKNLLYGLLLVSANDAAEVLARNSSFGKEGFILEMNRKAKILGLSDTQFTNPSGLQGDGNQYSSAYDLLVFTKYALERFPLFREIVKTYSYNIEGNSYHKSFYLENETNLLTSYPGVKGVKDGYTPEAGLCLITYLEHGKHKIISVILGSNDRRGEMKELLDYSLKKLGETPPSHK